MLRWVSDRHLIAPTTIDTGLFCSPFHVWNKYLALIKYDEDGKTQYYHVSEKERLQNYLLNSIHFYTLFKQSKMVMG